MVAESISVGEVKMGNPEGERLPRAGASSHPKIVSRKYHVELAPTPKAMNIQRRSLLTLRENRWSAPLFWIGDDLRLVLLVAALNGPEDEAAAPQRQNRTTDDDRGH